MADERKTAMREAVTGNPATSFHATMLAAVYRLWPRLAGPNSKGEDG